MTILNCGPEQQGDACNHDQGEENTENEDPYIGHRITYR